MKDYWKIEFNEVYGDQKSYSDVVVTKKILNEIKKLDQQFYIDYSEGKNTGYSKFYFEHIKDGEILERVRIHVGDGNHINDDFFDYIEKQLMKKYFINLKTIFLDV